MNNDRFEQLKLNFLPRFWDIVKKVMIYPEYQGRELVYRRTTTWGHDCFPLSNLLLDKDYIMMKPTSLKDKNGKLIYEGDLLTVRAYNKEKEKYENIKCNILWLSVRNGWALCSEKFEIIPDLYLQCSQINVIGTIHTIRSE